MPTELYIFKENCLIFFTKIIASKSLKFTNLIKESVSLVKNEIDVKNVGFEASVLGGDTLDIYWHFFIIVSSRLLLCISFSDTAVYMLHLPNHVHAT